jgi:Alcohol dehydrogenase GroES-like domain
MASSDQQFEIPKECKAGVVYNEGPDFEIKVEMVPVPEPGKTKTTSFCSRRHIPVYFNRTSHVGVRPLCECKWKLRI